MSSYSPNIEIWPGSGSFFPLTFTPFGFYDNDPEFQCDAESIAKWAALRLGFPIMDVELQEVNFYSAFEEAVNEYGAQLNYYQARDQMVNLQGQPTGSVNLSQKFIPQTLRGIFKLSKAYGTEAGFGGNQTFYTGSVDLLPQKQIYDLVRDTTIETGSFATDQFVIRRIFHENTPALSRLLDPTLGAGFGSQEMLSQFGWSSYSVPGNYLLMPLYHDVLRMQAVEFNDLIRKSGYSFQLTGNRLRIFPIPTDRVRLWFTYTLDKDASPTNSDTGLDGRISDISNIPYQTITYRFINEIGKQWIRRYCLALVTETLGYIRNKYASIPIPDGEVTLNGADLISAGKDKQDALMAELKEVLDSMSFQSQLERKTSVAENLQNQLKFVPLKIYIKALMPFFLLTKILL
jgi:hypothetical protein